MQRRAFLSSCACLTVAGTLLSPSTSIAQSSDTPIDVVAAIKALRIDSGPYAGGYEIAPNGRLNWYFTALGLLPIVNSLPAADLDKYIRSYLDLYLRCLTPQRFIWDVNFPVGRADPSNFTLVAADSDDSYAATFLSLATRYVQVSGNMAWWNANKAVLMEVAYRNMALTLKSNGLTSVFQSPRSQTNSIGYLMDNCEVYRGLRDFGAMLTAGGNAKEGTYYNALASSVAAGLARQFRTTTAGFTPGDAYSVTERSFYPGATCQVFPQAFGVQELAPMFDRAWGYLGQYAAGWEDGRYDSYPWAILGLVAAKRGQAAQARTQLRQVQGKFITQRALVTINELGFYQRTLNVLAGRVEV
jgi:hypothetical protein